MLIRIAVISPACAVPPTPISASESVVPSSLSFITRAPVVTEPLPWRRKMIGPPWAVSAIVRRSVSPAGMAGAFQPLSSVSPRAVAPGRSFAVDTALSPSFGFVTAVSQTPAVGRQQGPVAQLPAGTQVAVLTLHAAAVWVLIGESWRMSVTAVIAPAAVVTFMSITLSAGVAGSAGAVQLTA